VPRPPPAGHPRLGFARLVPTLASCVVGLLAVGAQRSGGPHAQLRRKSRVRLRLERAEQTGGCIARIRLRGVSRGARVIVPAVPFRVMTLVLALADTSDRETASRAADHETAAFRGSRSPAQYCAALKETQQPSVEAVSVLFRGDRSQLRERRRRCRRPLGLPIDYRTVRTTPLGTLCSDGSPSQMRIHHRALS
jgi:hypothetical protein